MKRGFYILLIMCTAIMVVSCDKTKSYTDMLKAQEKAIDRLRADSGLVFLEEFPTDSIFKENDTFLKEDIIPDESNIFEEYDNATDCYELSALFFVYKFLFR